MKDLAAADTLPRDDRDSAPTRDGPYAMISLPTNSLGDREQRTNEPQGQCLRRERGARLPDEAPKRPQVPERAESLAEY